MSERANDGGTLYRCPGCGASYVAYDQSLDGWRCDHGPTFPRPAHRWGEFYFNAAFDPAFRAPAETDPTLERIGTLAEYLGVGPCTSARRCASVRARSSCESRWEPQGLINEAHGLAARLVGRFGPGWYVETNYSTKDGRAFLYALKDVADG